MINSEYMLGTQGEILNEDMIDTIPNGNALMDGLALKRIVSTDSSGRVVMEFEAEERHCHAVVQGGYIAAWIDAAMARAVGAATDGEFGCNTLEIKVAYYAPALLGQTLTAEGWVERKGRSTVFLEGTLSNEKGEVLAKASSTAKLFSFGRRSDSG